MAFDELVSDIDAAVLSGGMSRVPYVRARMATLFGDIAKVEMAAEPPENAVVDGLAKAGNFGTNNMLRPAFDVLLECDDGQEFRLLCEAFLPILGNCKIAGGGDQLRYECHARLGTAGERKGQAAGRVPLRATATGHPRRSPTGRTSDRAGPRFEFSIYPDPRIRVVEANGIVDGLVEDWHRFGDD